MSDIVEITVPVSCVLGKNHKLRLGVRRVDNRLTNKLANILAYVGCTCADDPRVKAFSLLQDPANRTVQTCADVRDWVIAILKFKEHQRPLFTSISDEHQETLSTIARLVNSLGMQDHAYALRNEREHRQVRVSPNVSLDGYHPDPDMSYRDSRIAFASQRLLSEATGVPYVLRFISMVNSWDVFVGDIGADRLAASWCSHNLSVRVSHQYRLRNNTKVARIDYEPFLSPARKPDHEPFRVQCPDDYVLEWEHVGYYCTVCHRAFTRIGKHLDNPKHKERLNSVIAKTGALVTKLWTKPAEFRKLRAVNRACHVERCLQFIKHMQRNQTTLSVLEMLFATVPSMFLSFSDYQQRAFLHLFKDSTGLQARTVHIPKRYKPVTLLLPKF